MNQIIYSEYVESNCLTPTNVWQKFPIQREEHIVKSTAQTINKYMNQNSIPIETIHLYESIAIKEEASFHPLIKNGNLRRSSGVIKSKIEKILSKHGIYVSNLSSSVNQDGIRSVFKRIGPIKHCIFIGSVGAEDNAAIVSYYSRKHARQAYERLNNTIINGKPVEVYIGCVDNKIVKDYIRLKKEKLKRDEVQDFLLVDGFKKMKISDKPGLQNYKNRHDHSEEPNIRNFNIEKRHELSTLLNKFSFNT